MKIIATITPKGGAGKSTLAVCLAVEAQRRGLDTLLIDTDKSADTYNWAQRRENELPHVVHLSPALIPSHIEKARDAGAGFVVIDTAGKLDEESLACARLADLLVIPSQPSINDIKAIAPTIEIAMFLKKPHLAVINGMHPSAMAKFNDIRVSLEQDFGANVFPSYISRRQLFVDMFLDGTVPHEIDEDHKAGREISLLYNCIDSMLANNHASNLESNLIADVEL